MADIDWFLNARYGLFIHYGLYSILGRGEWVMNKERIPLSEYEKLKDSFTAEDMDFDKLIGKAKNDWGMRYAVLTTKHHEGFCLYDSKLTDYKSVNSPAKRDLVAEFVEACRKHEMKIGLYHTLNDWHFSPNAVDALEDMENNYQPFIDYVHGQIKEIMTGYGKIDVMWYDGWWPFNGELWQGEKLNAMVKELQPGILVNGRTGVKGDFGTPEGHITASSDPWEACMTLNNCWGFHKGDNNWKSAKTVIEMLIKCSQGQGNLLLNVGPEGSGKIPQKTVEILDDSGSWLKNNGDSIFNTKRFDFEPFDSSYGLGDWTSSGPLTANDAGEIFWNFTKWPGSSATLASVEGKVLGCEELSTGKSVEWKQEGDRLILTGMDEEKTCELPEVIKIKVSPETRIYGCGGCRTPKVEHCRYDPVEPDIAY